MIVNFYFILLRFSDASDESEDEEEDEKRPHPHWEDKIRDLELDIDERKRQLESVRNLGEGDRRRLAQELMAKEEDLNRIREEHNMLQQKLANIERKLIIGGENLLEKAEKQAMLLDHSNV